MAFRDSQTPPHCLMSGVPDFLVDITRLIVYKSYCYAVSPKSYNSTLTNTGMDSHPTCLDSSHFQTHPIHSKARHSVVFNDCTVMSDHSIFV